MSALCQTGFKLLNGTTIGLRSTLRNYSNKGSNTRGRAFNWQKRLFSAGLVGSSVAAASLLLKNNSDDSRIPIFKDDIEAEKLNGNNSNESSKRLDNIISNCRRLVVMKKEEQGLPGLVIGVSVNGEIVWQEGFGYADVENLAECRADTAMRIASISKPITAAMAARLVDLGKLDIDLPIQKYINFPVKKIKGEEVIITTRQLMGQLGGIRPYEKNSTKDSISDGEMAEFYNQNEYKTTTDALEIFKHDDLEHKPGEKYLYTTYGWTLISAVLEGAAGVDFPTLSCQLFRDLGMNRTVLGYHIPLIMNQARYYKRTARSRLENAPYVDLSCKWAGGGFVSTVEDLCIFANTLLTSYQNPSGFIKNATITDQWTASVTSMNKVNWAKNGGYGLGWGVATGNKDLKRGNYKPSIVSHTGGSCGASSVLTIVPIATDKSRDQTSAPRGVVVAILTNLQAVRLSKLSEDICDKFIPLAENDCE